MTTLTQPHPLDGVIGVEPDREPLTSRDRCDACGARAYVAATVNGVELLYCAHHATAYEDRLAPIASTWHDERAVLTR